MMCMEFYLTTSIITVDQRYMPEMIPDYYYRKRGHIMEFTKKIWKNRIAEYINRRLLTMEDGSTNLVTVARDEGTISQEGDAFNAANMNDLEDRIEAGFDEVNRSLTTENGTKFRFGQNSDGEYGYIINKDGADTVIPFKHTENTEYTFDLWAYTVSVNDYSTSKVELPCKDFTLLSRTKLAEYNSVGTALIGYKDDGTSVKLSEDKTDLSNVNITDYVKLETYVNAAYHHGNFKFKLTLSS